MFELLVSDALRLCHLLAVAVGFGVAVETEAFMIRRRRGPISPGMLSGLDHRHHVILWALGAMWVTGLALIALRTGFQLDAFSPKLWAKITVVTVLTINALFVAEVAMPILAGHRGRKIAELPEPARNALFSVAGVSGASWLMALALGSSAVLKVSPAPLFQTGLPVAYITGIIAANLVGRRLYAAPRRARAIAPRQGRAAPALQPATAPAARASVPARAASQAAARGSDRPVDTSATRQPATIAVSGPVPKPEPKPAPKPGPKPAQAVAPTVARRPAHEPAPKARASDLAIAFPGKLNPGPRIRAEPRETSAGRAARQRLAAVAADLGTRR